MKQNRDQQAGDVAATLLAQAADLVAKARGMLNSRQLPPCGCCGARRHVNMMQARVYEQLSKTSESLRHQAQRLIDEADAGTGTGTSTEQDEQSAAIDAARTEK